MECVLFYWLHWCGPSTKITCLNDYLFHWEPTNSGSSGSVKETFSPKCEEKGKLNSGMMHSVSP